MRDLWNLEAEIYYDLYAELDLDSSFAKMMTPAGEEVELVIIGEGLNSIAFSPEDNPEIVYLHQSNKEDFVKEILSNLTPHYNDHLPVIESIGWSDLYNLGEKEEGLFYRMPRYSELTRNAETAFRQAEILQDCEMSVRRSDKMKLLRSKYPISTLGGDQRNMIIECLEGDKSGAITDHLMDAINMLSRSAADYGDHLFFEFPLCNLAVDENDDLILLDVIYPSNMSRKARRRRNPLVKPF